MYYLMIKEHNKTGLKYLCMKRTDDISKCYIYTGSGTYWRRHLKEHGIDIRTEIIFNTPDVNEFSDFALRKSKELGVPGKGWANIVPESGPGIVMTPEQKIIFSLKITGIQQGRSMKERIGKDYKDSRKGKKLSQIISTGRHSQQKPFKIVLNDGQCEWIFNNENEFQNTLKMYADPTLRQLKLNKQLIVKLITSRTKHNFKRGDKLTYMCLGDGCHRYRNMYKNIKLIINGKLQGVYDNINNLHKSTGISLYLFLKHVKSGTSLIAINEIGNYINKGDIVTFDI